MGRDPNGSGPLAGRSGTMARMAKKARRRRARAKSKANHGKRPNA